MKKLDAMLSDGEGLRHAVAWLAEQPHRNAAAIEEASRRFNLSPLDEQFLLEHFRESTRAGGESGDSSAPRRPRSG